MNHWIKYTLVALMVTAAGFSYFNNSRSHIPTDLRDAVAMDQLTGSSSNEAVALPAPVGVKAAAVKAPSAPLPEFIAGVALSDLKGDTAFDKLGSLFKEGVPAAKEDITGWYAGRTVYGTRSAVLNPATLVDMKDNFLAALLVGREIPLGGGPLFDGESRFRIFFAEKSQTDYYDNMSTHDTDLTWLSAMDTSHPDARLLKFPGATYAVETSWKKEVIEVRKARGYIVVHSMRYSSEVRRTLSNSHKKHTWLDTEKYSYFFKDVTPKK